MEDCVFCKIIKGKIPCFKVYEDNDFLGFLDISPANEGHTLVISKKHYETILDAPDEDLNKLLLVTKEIAKAIKITLKNTGFNILINNGKDSGQEVPHLHTHIIPRNEGDKGIISISWKPKQIPKEKMSLICEKIKEYLMISGAGGI